MLNMFHKFDLIAGKGEPIHLKSNSFSPTQIVRLLTFFLVEKKAYENRFLRNNLDKWFKIWLNTVFDASQSKRSDQISCGFTVISFAKGCYARCCSKKA